MEKKKLYKSRKNKMIGGVCGGLAEYFNMDPTIVRIVAALLCLLKGAGLIVYIIACLVMPYNDEVFDEENPENLKSANIDPEDEKKAEKKKSGLLGKVGKAILTAITSTLAAMLGTYVSDKVTGKKTKSRTSAKGRVVKNATSAATRTITKELTRDILGNLVK